MIKGGPGTGEVYEVAQAAILGRLDTNDIPVRDAKASREHAKIYKQGEQYAIVDLNSSNGTFVNGQRITKRVLKNGDEIEIGTVSLVFEMPPEAKTAPARKTLEDFDVGKGEEAKKAAPAAGSPADVVLRSHQPIQVRRIKPGSPLLGLDLDQLSDTGRVIVYVALVAVFAGLMYLAYVLVAG